MSTTIELVRHDENRFSVIVDGVEIPAHAMISVAHEIQAGVGRDVVRVTLVGKVHMRTDDT